MTGSKQPFKLLFIVHIGISCCIFFLIPESTSSVFLPPFLFSQKKKKKQNKKRKNTRWKKKKYVFNFSNCEIPFSTYANYISNFETRGSPLRYLYYVKYKNPNKFTIPLNLNCNCIMYHYFVYRIPNTIFNKFNSFVLDHLKGKKQRKKSIVWWKLHFVPFLHNSCFFFTIQ